MDATVLTALRAEIEADRLALERRAGIVRIFDLAREGLVALGARFDLRLDAGGMIELRADPDTGESVGLVEPALPPAPECFAADLSDDLADALQAMVEGAPAPEPVPKEFAPAAVAAKPAPVVPQAGCTVEPPASGGAKATGGAVVQANAGLAHLWTPKVEERMISLVGQMKAAEIGKQIGRTESAVYERLRKLRHGLVPLPPGWTVSGGVFVPVAPDAPSDQQTDDDWDHDPRKAVVAPQVIAVAAQDGPAVLTLCDDPRFAAAPQDDLTRHLLTLSRPVVGTWDLDSELCELTALKWGLPAIAAEMKLSERDVQARWDALTGFDRETRQRRFTRDDVVARMALLTGLAASGVAE